MKVDCLFSIGLNLSRIIQKKKCQEKVHFIDDVLTTRDIKYLNVETWFLFSPLSKFLARRLCLTFAKK